MSIIEKALNKANYEGQKLETLTNFNTESKKASDIANKSLNQPINIGNSIAGKEIVDIDWTRLSALGFLTPGDSNTQAIEEYRSIKRPIMSNAFGKGSVGINRANLILVTSSLPGEGKTFTAINLALSIANERDTQVLLIDADVARPSVSKVLGINPGLGLIDYLEEQDVSFSDIIIDTNMPGFRVVPAGKLHKYSTELLSSDKMVLLVEELSNRYPDRIIIFDSPPLLAATQGEVLAKLVGQVLLVVEAEKLCRVCLWNLSINWLLAMWY